MDQNDDLSNEDQVPLNARSLIRKNHSCTFSEANEAVIKMIIKGRSPDDADTCPAHRVALDWLFEKINLNVQDSDKARRIEKNN